jgi:hypothetical protein
MIRIGAKPVDNKYAQLLTDKKILDLNPDGYHYTRLIQGEPHEKVILGFIDLSPESEMELHSQGINIKELSPNIKFDK